VTGYASSAGFGPVFTEGTPCKTKKKFNRGAALGAAPGKLVRSSIVVTPARRGVDIKLDSRQPYSTSQTLRSHMRIIENKWVELRELPSESASKTTFVKLSDIETISFIEDDSGQIEIHASTRNSAYLLSRVDTLSEAQNQTKSFIESHLCK
jgi:hypothetical protein